MAVQGWDVDPAGVSKVLTNCSPEAGKFEKLFEGFGDALGAVVEPTKSGIIGQALQNYMTETVQPGLNDIGGRIQNIFDGTQQAANAYVEGSKQQAEKAEKLVSAPAPELPKPKGGSDGHTKPEAV